MAKNHRRGGVIAGMAVGAVLAAPLIALLASPLASADPADPAASIGGDVTTTPYSFLGITDDVSNNADTGGFDNLLTIGNTDLDIFSNGSDTYGFLFTDGDVFQEGFEVVDGTPTFIDVLNPALPVDFDPGFADIGGIP
jgi:hypothetical protein